MVKKILIINPNSSESMTNALKPLIPKLTDVEVSYYTGPASAPPEIDGYATSIQSAKACFPEIEAVVSEYDAFLVACFSDHPLIYQLQEITDKPVKGIFQSSIMHSMNEIDHHPSSKFAILTSNIEWERILDLSLYEYFNGKIKDAIPSQNEVEDKLPDFVVPTLASEVNVLELSNPKKFKFLQEKVQTLVEKGAKIIILGCAGLSGLDQKFGPLFPDVMFVDSVKAGVEILAKEIEDSA